MRCHPEACLWPKDLAVAFVFAFAVAVAFVLFLTFVLLLTVGNDCTRSRTQPSQPQNVEPVALGRVLLLLLLRLLLLLILLFRFAA